MHFLKGFGCAAFVRIHARYRDKFDPRAKRCMYVGIPSQKKGYRLLDLDTHTIVYSRDATFDETTFPKLKNLTSPPDTPALPYTAHWPVSAPTTPPPLQSPVPHPVLPSVGDLFRQDYKFVTDPSTATESPPPAKRPRTYEAPTAENVLKQPPRVWYQTLSTFLISLGCHKLIKDQCVFMQTQHGLTSYIAVYVDDLLIIAPTVALVREIKPALHKRFSMTDLGEVNTYSGGRLKEIARSVRSSSMSTNTPSNCSIGSDT
ncbi:TPA: hypothetical protein N0F65_003242 [Lagenidium giganteum]|uniref:Reverse transcriptase Ty1/copia-type domain-containing protein n=1 Tax=Lagenidium giganteum TaxID=4803 RepID=A0AAV2ZAK1_9STRA|nr:TPA: hypothetical protein N0F65_003242 [Lagenidium giganteum]